MSEEERMKFIMKTLSEKFGINSIEEFYEEYKKMKPLDISIFTTPYEESMRTSRIAD